MCGDGSCEDIAIQLTSSGLSARLSSGRGCVLPRTIASPDDTSITTTTTTTTALLAAAVVVIMYLCVW